MCFATMECIFNCFIRAEEIPRITRGTQAHRMHIIRFDKWLNVFDMFCTNKIPVGVP